MKCLFLLVVSCLILLSSGSHVDQPNKDKRVKVGRKAALVLPGARYEDYVGGDYNNELLFDADICDTCVPTNECPLFESLNVTEQLRWMEKYPCGSLPKVDGFEVPPGFASAAIGDEVCCANIIWGIEKPESSGNLTDYGWLIDVRSNRPSDTDASHINSSNKPEFNYINENTNKNPGDYYNYHDYPNDNSYIPNSLINEQFNNHYYNKYTSKKIRNKKDSSDDEIDTSNNLDINNNPEIYNVFELYMPNNGTTVWFPDRSRNYDNTDYWQTHNPENNGGIYWMDQGNNIGYTQRPPVNEARPIPYEPPRNGANLPDINYLPPSMRPPIQFPPRNEARPPSQYDPPGNVIRLPPVNNPPPNIARPPIEYNPPGNEYRPPVSNSPGDVGRLPNQYLPPGNVVRPPFQNIPSTNTPIQYNPPTNPIQYNPGNGARPNMPPDYYDTGSPQYYGPGGQPSNQYYFPGNSGTPNQYFPRENVGRPPYNQPDNSNYIPRPITNNPWDQNYNLGQGNGINNNIYDYNNPYYGNPYDSYNYDNNLGYGSGQCRITSFPPDPQSQCCGRQLADDDRITGWENKPYNNNWGSPYDSRPRWTRAVSDNDTDVTVENRIAGGHATELYQYPWTVLLLTTFNYGTREASFNCGGGLISAKYVLTAGHCVYDQGAAVKSVQVNLAEYDKNTFPRDCKSTRTGRRCIDNIVMYVEEIVTHPSYDNENLVNDIALLRLGGSAPYSEYIRPICLPTFNIDEPQFADFQFEVAGWGRTGPYTSNIKQSTSLHLVNHSQCRQYYPQLTDKHLCAAGKRGEDTCKGDSGGPLMILYRGRYYVAGIVSGKRADSPCGTAVPSLYTNVYGYVGWIRNNIRN